MTPDIEERIGRMRTALGRDPNGIVAGELPPGAVAGLDVLEQRCPPYAAFLRVCDGGRFGSVDFCNSKGIWDAQYLGSDLPTAGQGVVVIGQLLYEPLLCTQVGDVACFSHDDGSPGRMLGTLDAFLLSLLGPGYPSVIPDGAKDEWWGVLRAAGLAS